MPLEMRATLLGIPVRREVLKKGDQNIFTPKKGPVIYMEASLNDSIRVHEGWPPAPDQLPHFRYYQGREINKLVRKKKMRRGKIFQERPHWKSYR